MDPHLSAALKTAITLWTVGAVEHLKGHSENMAELKKGMEDDDNDVRIVFSVRANCIAIETIDRAKNMFAEIFREQLVPDDGGFALPDIDKKH